MSLNTEINSRKTAKHFQERCLCAVGIRYIQGQKVTWSETFILSLALLIKTSYKCVALVRNKNANGRVHH